MSLSERAVIDRFEGRWAVLLIGTAGKVLHIRRSLLPPHAHEGAWLRVEFADAEKGAILILTLDDEETARTRKRIAEKLEGLRRGDHLK